MTCPSCGGSQRTELAPGFYECQTTVVATSPGPGYGAPPTGQFGPQHITTTHPCGYRYQEGSSSSPGLACVAGCGRFAVGTCTSCGQPVCGLCSPGNGPLLCPTHRAEKRARADEREAELARQKAATPEARAQRARQLVLEHSATFKEKMRANGWNFKPVESATVELLRRALPELKARAARKAERLTISKSLGRTEQVRGWTLGSYTQESGNERDPGPSFSLTYVVCEDGTVRVASHGAGGLQVPKYRGALHLAGGAVKGGTVHHDQQGHLLFGNTQRIEWRIRELLDEGDWADVVLRDLEVGTG